MEWCHQRVNFLEFIALFFCLGAIQRYSSLTPGRAQGTTCGAQFKAHKVFFMARALQTEPSLWSSNFLLKVYYERTNLWDLSQDLGLLLEDTKLCKYNLILLYSTIYTKLSLNNIFSEYVNFYRSSHFALIIKNKFKLCLEAITNCFRPHHPLSPENPKQKYHFTVTKMTRKIAFFLSFPVLPPQILLAYPRLGDHSE